MLRDGHVVSTHKATYEPQSVAISPSQSEVSVGGGDRVSSASTCEAQLIYRYQVPAGLCVVTAFFELISECICHPV